MPPTPVVAARSVVRSYGERRALDGFTLDIPEGSVFGLLGPNGSGKSTFIAMLAAMDQPDSGTIEVFGDAPSPAARGRIGTVFQENASDPLMSATEYLRFAARLFSVGSDGRAGRISQLLERFGLTDRAREPIGQLSGGMRRRLEAARALLHEPALLLLDEPTTGVDPDERKALWETILAMREGRTILLATNDLPEADSVCDQVAFIQDGRVIATGSPAELKRGLRRDAIQVTWPEASSEDIAAIERLPGAGEVTADGDTLLVLADNASEVVPAIFQVGGNAIRGVRIEPATLADAYFRHVRSRARVAV
jgi:ABC-2 type transport system ATP-binding protein